MDGDQFTFEVRVADTGSHLSETIVTIDIVDINDNPPEIQQTPEELFSTIPENHPAGSVIATITARDVDLGTNAEFSFALQGGAGHFEIGLRSGVVRLVTSLGALEAPYVFPLTAYAIDTGGLNDSVNFIVNLTYSNDHPPVFNPSFYFGSVLECAPDGTYTTPRITISATDADSNGVVSYYTESSLFQLDLRPGRVADVLAHGFGKFDRETNETIEFLVYATDSTSGTEDDSARVIITIDDCNDNNPIFTQDFYEVDVYENTIAGTTVTQVHTNDADIGTNAEVHYRIFSVDPPALSGVFRTDELSGEIITSVDITSEYTGSSTCSSLGVMSNNITLVIEATDQATEQAQLRKYTTVFIRLLDRNFDAPSFQPTHFYSFSIIENVENIQIGRVNATDVCDINSTITYSIVPGFDSEPFRINSNTVLSIKIASRDICINFTIMLYRVKFVL